MENKTGILRRRRTPLVIAAILAALAFYTAGTSFVVITKIDNGEFNVNKYQMVEEDFAHPRLQELRKREKLDEVVAAGKTQFEKIVLLRAWAHRQWPGGKVFYYPPWDAIEILDLARKYKNYGFCAQYSVVFVQACQSLGLHARYVNLPEHFAAAVWSDEFNRWVMMDPTYDLHYERNGIPLKGRDLYQAYREEDTKNIYKVDSAGTKTPITREDIAQYKQYAILLRANHLSAPVLITRGNSQPEELRLRSDYRQYPLIGRDKIGFGGEMLTWQAPEPDGPFAGSDYSDDPDDFRSVKNQTMIFFANRKVNTAKLKLFAENSPTFASFLVNKNNAGWMTGYDRRESLLFWNLKPGFNTLSARILTSYGWLGRESRLELFYKPPLSMPWQSGETANR